MTETSAIHNSYAQWASCNENNESVMSENSSMTETSAVHDPYTQWASCNENDKSVMLKISDMTETSAVYHLHTQRASCVMLKRISDVTEAHTVQHLSAQEASWDSVREFRYAESEQHSIKNSAADTAAMNISNTVNHALIDL